MVNILFIILAIVVLVIKKLGEDAAFQTKASQMEREGAFLPQYPSKNIDEDFKAVYDDLNNREFKIIPKEYKWGMIQVKDALPQYAKAYTQEKAIKAGYAPPWVPRYNKFVFDPWEYWNAEFLPKVLEHVRE